MCPIPNYEDDIFISYAHVDNQPLAEGLQGWVETLHERLKIRLTQLLGEEVKIWRDRKLQGNDVLADTLDSQIGKVAILVSIISPRYVKSEWCLKELNEFCKLADTNGGLRVGDKMRIFKIVKTHIPLTEHPPQLQGTLGYEFYEYDPERGRAKEFSPEVVPTRDIRYWEKLDDLAYDIKQIVENLVQQQPAKSDGATPTSDGSTAQADAAQAVGAVPAAESGVTIYLAQSTSDVDAERDQIKRDLQQHGHIVLPDRELPLQGAALQEAVAGFLSRSDFSIHLIGEYYGIVPEGESRSIVHLQSEMATARGDDFPRIVWMPIGLASGDERQQKLIDELRLGHSTHKGTEVLQTKFEDLKTLVHDQLTKRNKPEPAPALSDAEGGRFSVYLICDRQDMDAASAIESYLFDLGADVILPVMEGDETQVYEDHKANLLDCDAVLIYYGQANEIWLRMKQRELQKIAGYGRTKPLLAKGIYAGGPQTAPKERLRDHEAVVMKNYGAFTAESLQPFFEQVQKSKGARAQ